MRIATIRDLLDTEHRLYLANSSYFIVLEPLTLPDCKDIIQHGLERVDSFTTNSGSPPSSDTLCGWNKKQRVCLRGFQASMEKTCDNLSAQSVMERTWHLLTTPSTWEKLHSPDYNTRIRLVQLIDEDHMVFFRDCAAKDGDEGWILESTMTLLSRTKTNNGYMLQLTGLDRERLPVQDRLGQRTMPNQGAGKVVEVWSAHVYWVKLEQDGIGCKATLGGMSPGVSAYADFWLEEVIRQGLRWERAVRGLKFTLPSNDTTPSKE